MIKYSELLVTVMLNSDIPINISNETISNFINYAMNDDEELRKLHLTRMQFKFYTFSSFYPIEKDAVYKKGKIYTFTIRSASDQCVDKLKIAIKKIKSNPIYVIASEKKIKKQRFISEIRTLTPVVVTNNSSYIQGNDDKNLKKVRLWIQGDDIEFLKNRLHSNLKKKFETYYKTKLDDTELFFNGIEIGNKYPIFLRYKGGFLVGNKFKLQVKSDPISQSIATMSLSSGLGEKNSIGMGFCLYY